VEACGGGVGRHVRSLCQGLIAEGYHVTVAYAPYRADEAFQGFVADKHNGIDFLPLKLKRAVSPGSDLSVFVQVLRLIRNRGPFDVVHGHSSKGGAIARLCGRWLSVPTVYTPHGLNMASPRVSLAKRIANAWAERIMGYGATSKIISVSEGERDFILRRNLIYRKRVALITNGLEARDLDYFWEHRLMRNAIDQWPLTFGSIMRFSPPKTPGCLIEAFARLCAAMPRVTMRLVLVGDGELLAGARRQVEESGLNERVSFLGWQTDARKMLLGFDIFVLSSLSEGGSYTILDAMAAGLPVISTDVFGTRETIAQVSGNVLVPVDDPEALARGMQQTAGLAVGPSSRTVLERIGQANHDYVRTHFRQSETTRRTIEVYRGLAGKKRNPILI
jgi:glycosyltransferase involved in cell wall biosynthesis